MPDATPCQHAWDIFEIENASDPIVMVDVSPDGIVVPGPRDPAVPVRLFERCRHCRTWRSRPLPPDQEVIQLYQLAPRGTFTQVQSQ